MASSLPSPFLPITSHVCKIGNSILQQDGKDHADLSELMIREEKDDDDDDDIKFVIDEKENR